MSTTLFGINVAYYLPERVNQVLYRLGVLCHCGSGAHPRRCYKHPWAYRAHVTDLNLNNIHEYYDELERRVDMLERTQKW